MAGIALFDEGDPLRSAHSFRMTLRYMLHRRHRPTRPLSRRARFASWMRLQRRRTPWPQRPAARRMTGAVWHHRGQAACLLH